MARRKKDRLLVDYFEEWIELYKEGAVAEITVRKYWVALEHLRDFCPKLFLSDLDRKEYQKIINWYGKTHERQTVMDFHHQVKSAVLDAVDEGLIEINPTRKVVIKGKEKSPRKSVKFINKEDLHKLLAELDLSWLKDDNHAFINFDWLINIAAKTGLRYAELLALTPADFEWKENTLTVNKSWNYKNTQGSFSKTKTNTSNRTITIDWQIVGQFMPLIKEFPVDEPIFVEKFPNGVYKRVFNSTINNKLKKLCEKAEIPIITCHSLRHTHASVLLAEGVSINTISARLGHSDISITQETYTHILKELEQKDNQLMMATLMQL